MHVHTHSHISKIPSVLACCMLFHPHQIGAIWWDQVCSTMRPRTTWIDLGWLILDGFSTESVELLCCSQISSFFIGTRYPDTPGPVATWFWWGCLHISAACYAKDRWRQSESLDFAEAVHRRRERMVGHLGLILARLGSILATSHCIISPCGEY